MIRRCRRTSVRARGAGLPPVGRLGFDRGWLRLRPTFLGLGLAGMLVDSRWTGPGAALGLEVFGERDPRRPFVSPNLAVDVWGRHTFRLVSHTAGDSVMVLADATFTLGHDDAWWVCAHQVGRVLVVVGDTYRVGLSWAALFDCTVGVARVLPLPGAAPAAQMVDFADTGISASRSGISPWERVAS